MSARYVSKKRGPFRRYVVPLLTVSLLLFGVWVLLFRVNRFTFRVELHGDAEQRLEYEEPYLEKGAETRLYGTFFWKEGRKLPDPKLEGEVDTTALGTYHLTYSADFLWFHDQAVRTVQVVDTQPPMIVLTREPGIRQNGEPFQEPGFTAYDNHDGNITKKVTQRKEPGQITYAVTDSSGNSYEIVRPIPDYDPFPPEILLKKGVKCQVTLGVPFEEPGWAAYDATDGDLTEEVTVEGEVDCLTPGTYPILYTVMDSNHNEVVVRREVEVVGKPQPERIWLGDKVIFLTFDDGPGPETPRLLDILDRYGVKATFFVTDSGYDDILQDIAARGHAIGVHCASHRYTDVYESPEAYFADLYYMQNRIRELTGIETTLLRFPGGSSNTVSKQICKGIMTLLTDAVQEAGFQYFDWNVSSGDAGGTKNPESIYENVINGIQNVGTSIVLQHDIYGYSIDAVENIIRWGQANGYTFASLDPTSPGFHHEAAN